MADETTTPADSTNSTTKAPDAASTSEQQAAPDTQAVETDPNAPSEADTSLLGGDLNNEADSPREDDEVAKPEHVVPDAYELSVEGLELDAASIEEAAPVFKEIGLSNDQANKLMPVAAKFRDRVVQQLADAGAAQKADWLKATKADPDIGGAKLEETTHLAAKALDHFGITEGTDFRRLLTETGFGNHPDMVRVMRGVGEMLSEDGFPRSGAGNSTQPKPLHERLYPSKAQGA